MALVLKVKFLDLKTKDSTKILGAVLGFEIKSFIASGNTGGAFLHFLVFPFLFSSWSDLDVEGQVFGSGLGLEGGRVADLGLALALKVRSLVLENFVFVSQQVIISSPVRTVHTSVLTIGQNCCTQYTTDQLQ